MERIQTHIDLDATMRSGQTFHWRSGERGSTPDGVETRYYETTIDGRGIRLFPATDGVAFEGDVDRRRVTSFLGLDHDVEAVLDGIDDPRVAGLATRHDGLRLVDDAFWRCTVSFIASSQNSISRIRRIVNRIADTYGEPIDGLDVARFPDAETLAEEAGERALRELKLGYRAPYVASSSKAVASGAVDPDAIRDMPYERAHEAVQQLHGVGDKVADCILLFSLGFGEAVPIDRWMWRTIERDFPELHGDDYAETRDRFQERFGDDAGYVQNVLFHAARTGEDG